MRSTFYGLEIAKTGVMISRNELDITSHNISNADTIGYTRQRLYTQGIPAAKNGAFLKPDILGMSGKGVAAITVEQIRNPFLDYQYRKENATATNWSIKDQYFGYVESLFNNELDDIDISTGMSSLFANFYSSLDKLSQGATPDLEIRANVKNSAEKLLESMQYYYNRLVDQQDTLDKTIEVTVEQINDYAKQIAALNEQIFSYELSGQKANDLRDQRNLLMDQLSGLADVTYDEDANGYYSVRLDDRFLVRHTQYNQLGVDKTLDNPAGNTLNKLNEVYWANSDGTLTTKKVSINDGALKGYMQIRDGNSEGEYGIPLVINQLNDLARMMVREMNQVHQKGWTMSYVDDAGNVVPSKTGVDFFEQPAGADVTDASDPAWQAITAGNISISQAIKDSVYNIAASDVQVGDPTTGDENEKKGNNVIALQLGQLLSRKDDAGNSVGFNSVYAEIVVGIGTAQDHFGKLAESQTIVANQVEEQRQSISGVSLDEEMTDMIRFSHAFNAASRMISAMDEQLETLINKMGRVGL